MKRRELCCAVLNPRIVMPLTFFVHAAYLFAMPDAMRCFRCFRRYAVYGAATFFRRPLFVIITPLNAAADAAVIMLIVRAALRR